MDTSRSSLPDELDELDDSPAPLGVGGWPLIAHLLGGTGVFLGLIVTLVFSTVGDINHLAGGHLSPLRGVLGLLGALLGVAGVALLSSRLTVAVLLLIVASALFFVAFHLYGLIASPFLLLAALLAVVGRGSSNASTAAPAQPNAPH